MSPFGFEGSYSFQSRSASRSVSPEATKVITRQAWSEAPFDSAPLARSPSTGRIRAAPRSGMKVIEVSSAEVVGRFMSGYRMTYWMMTNAMAPPRAP